MASLHVRKIVAERPVEAVVRRRVGGRSADRRETVDADHAHQILARDEREVGRGEEGGQLLEAEPAVREARRVENRGTEDPFVLGREELIARHRIGAVVRKSGSDALVGAVVRVPRKHRVGIAERVVEASLVEVLARRLVLLVGEDADALRGARVAGVRRREQLQVRRHDRIDRKERTRSRGVGRHERSRRDAEILLQPLDAAEEEEPVLLQRTTEARSELMARERRRIVAPIEEVARVHRAVAEELEARAADVVRAALRHEADHAAHRAAVIGRVGVGDDAKFHDRVDPQRRLGGGDRRRTRVPPHVRPVEQIAVRSEAHAVDVQLRPAVR